MNTLPSAAFRCTHGTIKIENNMLIIAKGCFQGNAWMVPLATITGIAITGHGLLVDVWLQAPGGGFRTKMNPPEAQKLQQFHMHFMMMPR